MTDAQAWRTIAAWWAEAKPDNIGWYATSHGRYGLCVSVYDLALSEHRTERLLDQLWILYPGVLLCTRFWWPPEDKEGAECRVLAACFLAAMAEES